MLLQGRNAVERGRVESTMMINSLSLLLWGFVLFWLFLLVLVGIGKFMVWFDDWYGMESEMIECCDYHTNLRGLSLFGGGIGKNLVFNGGYMFEPHLGVKTPFIFVVFLG